MNPKILLYTGPGAGKFSVGALTQKIRSLFDSRYEIVFFRSFQECLRYPDPKTVRAVCVPGGHAPTMKVQGGLISNEKEFVDWVDRYAISYYGVCAGGIIAGSSLHKRVAVSGNTGCFDPEGESFSGLFPGKVFAPVFPKFRPEISSGLLQSVEDLHILSLESIPSQVSVSPVSAHFLGPGYLAIPGSKGILRYVDIEPFSLQDPDNPLKDPVIAIEKIFETVLYTRPSGASLLLTGSHHEVGSDMVFSDLFRQVFPFTKEQKERLAQKLRPSDEERNELMKRMFREIGIV